MRRAEDACLENHEEWFGTRNGGQHDTQVHGDNGEDCWK